MAGSEALSERERRLLEELLVRKLRFMLVGMSAALIQGVRGSTEDIDLWFEDATDPRIGEAVRAVGGVWISGSFGMTPPRIGGDALGDRFDVVTHMSGLGRFSDEVAHVRTAVVDGLELPVLSLERILVSKKAAARPKDLLAAHLIEDTLAILDDEKSTDR